MPVRGVGSFVMVIFINCQVLSILARFLACVLSICRGKLMNSYLCRIVKAYVVKQLRW